MTKDCKKCGGLMSGPRWVRELDMLRWTCACGYEYESLPCDAKEKAAQEVVKAIKRAAGGER